MSEAQVKARFFTKEDDETLRASDAPLFVPTSLKRYGLSEVVNHLLEKEEPVPFDFLIDGVLLRSSLDEYLTKNGLSAEATLQIEYTRAVLPPSFLASYNDDDWVSSIATINHASPAVAAQRGASLASPQILAGSYDGVVRTYNMSGLVETQYVGHLAPVRAVQWVYANRIVSAGNDRQVRLWKTAAAEGVGLVDDDDDKDDKDDKDAQSGRTLVILDAHKAPVVALDVSVASHRLLSAGSDGVVGFWSTVPKEMNVVEPYAVDASGAGASSALKKRRRMALKDSGVKHRAPLALLESHTQPVEGVVFDSRDSLVGYSVSQDHTIKTWDLVTSRCVDTRSTGYALLSVLQLPGVGLIASGSSARHINLHDPRTQAGATEKGVTKLLGHTNFVVDLAACPTNDTMFASASHDGTVKVWDVRADRAMYTITRESRTGKVFGVSWDREIGIVSGGEDKKVQINSNPSTQK
ncbi:microtubule-associated protein YTM1 [Metschnikowia bicuspidata var. bicuspidata NRRL YB-4993]|uniref:Ribosome biogenesis protein YTM1 n=1 Tax=Metschnikowia bicuspidata var. bicuspidata NRRL YB-4993 TaxID=869754 RepID=A0A1A0HA46_9ASCO|nr:microtubule-associated protein YTM1 [Metschnikowia bicuspidata var. bicuspidata NRRL YB-4993]OBA20875.1 microtubule-associated protein YTM1 [Metschnikowia bicuspidata var. bicuspidata NRRL YB-4993]